MDTEGFVELMVTDGESDPLEVVAVVLTWHGRVGMFKRSAMVRHDQGLWHCITGFVELGKTPAGQAVEEVYQEAGLCVGDLNTLEQGPTLRLSGGGDRWVVYTFRAETQVRRLTINWEHQAHRWVKPGRISRFGRVSWLDDVIAAVDLET